MTYPRAVLITWLLALLLALLLAYDMAHAGEAFLDLAGGGSRLIPTAPDGVWCQQAFGCRYQPPISAAFKVGAGYRFGEANHWAIEGAALDLGTIKLKHQPFVNDQDYDPHNHRVLNGASPMYLTAKDRLYGMEVTLSRTFEAGDWRPYAKLGGALLWHTLNVTSSANPNPNGFNLTGKLPMVTLGVGVQHGLFYLETNYYTAVTPVSEKNGWPIATHAVVAFFGVRLPLFQ